MVGLRIIPIFIFGFVVAKPALSQTLPSCISIASDADGDGYGWENDASCVITSTSLTSPTFTNLETGEPVNVVRAQWSPSDFAGNQITCDARRFDGVSYSSIGPGPLYVFQPLSQTAPHNGNVTAFEPALDGTDITHSWTISNGIYFGPSDLAATPWVEIITLSSANPVATRVWLTNQSYTLCANLEPTKGLAPSGSLLTNIDNCDYTNAAQNNGWGWDAVAGESCEPTNSSVLGDCDYTDAAQYDGWGWNAVTGQSCEPVTSASQCIDSDGDGWGWDGTESCRME